MKIVINSGEEPLDLINLVRNSSNSYSVNGVLSYLLRIAEFGLGHEESTLNTEGLLELFEDGEIIGTEHVYMNRHDGREETTYYVYAVIEEDILLRITDKLSSNLIYYNAIDHANECTVEVRRDSRGRKHILVKDKDGIAIVGKDQILLEPEKLSESAKITDIITPVSIETLIERVTKNRTK